MMHPEELKAELAIKADKFLNEIHNEFCRDGLLSVCFSWSQSAVKNGMSVVEKIEINLGDDHGGK